jgi:hypothetical protein
MLALPLSQQFQATDQSLEYMSDCAFQNPIFVGWNSMAHSQFRTLQDFEGQCLPCDDPISFGCQPPSLQHK